MSTKLAWTCVPVKNTGDCNDHDAKLYPGHPEPCVGSWDDAGPDPGSCTTGQITCLADGAQSACTSACTLCAPNALGCDGLQPQQCNGAGDVWTPVGAACSGQACVAGQCMGTCAPGATRCGAGSSVDLVETCDATGSWGPAQACPSGNVCEADAGGCAGGACYIGGTYVAAGAPDPGNACRSCQPPALTTAWTNVADGSPCGGDTCCSGICSSLATDVDDCGQCGYVCKAGPSPACSSGWCNYTLASGQYPPGGMAVDATSVYWSDPTLGAIVKVPVGGGNATTIGTGVGLAQALALDATNVYYASGNPNGIGKVPIAGGPATVLLSMTVPPTALAVHAGNLYWTQYDPGMIVTMPVGGGTPTTLATLASGSTPSGIVVDDASVYWTDANFSVATGSGEIVKIPVGGGNPTTLASGLDLPGAMALDAANVYWIDDTDDTVMKVPVGGGNASTLAKGQAGQSQPVAVATDGASVFWTASYSYTVTKVPVGGGTPTTLASELLSPFDIVVDATSVYWAADLGSNSGESTIVKAPKQ